MTITELQNILKETLEVYGDLEVKLTSRCSDWGIGHLVDAFVLNEKMTGRGIIEVPEFLYLAGD